MANKQKTGLTYYPMEVGFFNDIKIRKLIKRKGGESVSVYTNLLGRIYKNGYYLEWDDELPFIISEDIDMAEDYISQVISECYNIGLLSKKTFEKYNVLTSKGIQERYILICKQLKRSAIVTEFLVNSSEEKAIVSEEIPNSSESIPQRKVKKSKVKEIKLKVKENIELTPSEIENLKIEFTEDTYLEAVEFLSQYKLEKGYKTKDDNLTIRRWVINAVNERKSKKNYDNKKNIGDRTQPGGFGNL